MMVTLPSVRIGAVKPGRRPSSMKRKTAGQSIRCGEPCAKPVVCVAAPGKLRIPCRPSARSCLAANGRAGRRGRSAHSSGMREARRCHHRPPRRQAAPRRALATARFPSRLRALSAMLASARAAKRRASAAKRQRQPVAQAQCSAPRLLLEGAGIRRRCRARRCHAAAPMWPSVQVACRRTNVARRVMPGRRVATANSDGPGRFRPPPAALACASFPTKAGESPPIRPRHAEGPPSRRAPGACPSGHHAQSETKMGTPA